MRLSGTAMFAASFITGYLIHSPEGVLAEVYKAARPA